MRIIENHKLTLLNTFGIEAHARRFVELVKPEDLKAYLAEVDNGEPRFILGGGSNILLTQDFDGTVVKLSNRGILRIEETDTEVLIQVGAGENWHDLVLWCVEQGYGGIENMSLIPGQVGAAPMQNIGAYGVELKDVFEELEAYEIRTGNARKFKASDCEFGYRSSVFKTELRDQMIIWTVTLRLSKQAQVNLSYGAIGSTLEKMGVKKPSIRDVSNAVIAIRQSKLPDPAQLGNSGSFFKNPIIDSEQHAQLKTSYAGAPTYDLHDGTFKVAAGWLIEQCGFKGCRKGNTGTYKNQALVIVNYGGASGDEILAFSKEIQAAVKEKFGIELEREVNLVQ